MEKSYSHLLQPIKIGGKLYKNRYLTAPTGHHALQGGQYYPTDATIAYYAEKARGGAAAVTLGAFTVEKGRDDDFVHIRWHLDEMKKPFNMRYFIKLTDAIHMNGSLAAVEAGYNAPRTKDGYAYGPCDEEDVPMFGKRVAMPEEIMYEVSRRYADLAENLVLAGFDSVTFMCAHGMGWAEWTNPNYNKRTDQYGGSVENMARFPRMVFEAMKERVGDELLIEYRISGYEFEPNSPTLFNTVEHVKQMEDVIDLIHLSAGTNLNPSLRAVTHPSGFLNPATNSFLAKTVKESGVKVPVVAIGAIFDPDVAENLIANGTADFVTSARGWIAEPHIIKKTREDRADEIRPCIKCFRCLDGYKKDIYYNCSVNPESGREWDIRQLVLPPERSKSCAVIGGGPAGMQCALTLAGRGHSVTLYEKSDRLGGNLCFSDFVSFKRDLRGYKDYLIHMVGKNERVKVELNTEATPDFIAERGFDAVFAAVGAEPVIPGIPGVEGENVIPATDVYSSLDRIGRRVVVIGGGQVGCETGLDLAMRGHEVTILEMLSELAPDAIHTHRVALMQKLDQFVTGRTGTRVTGLLPDGVAVVTDGVESVIEADTVILAAGMRARSGEAESFLGTAFDVSFIGDCVKAKTVSNAVRTAYDAASRT